jgi:ABC exporter DevB family membrane fusion protein
VAEAHADVESSAVAAPGRVEPVSEEVKIGSSIYGKLKTILVEEGARVRRGQVIAMLDNAEYAARVAVAGAQVAEMLASERRVLNGAREQERAEALAAVNEAEAIRENARAEVERRRKLYGSGDISRSDLERVEREFRVAESRLDAARQRHGFVDASARPEDRAKAEADVSLARARLAEAQAMLDKTIIRSPIDGVVLRKHMNAGEVVSDKSDYPIVTVGDSSVLRVRADVDETDIAKIKVGQRAYVKADAYGEKKFRGRVVRVGQALGKKNVRTDRPAERVDTKILETLIELDAGQSLPPGLRVDAFIG